MTRVDLKTDEGLRAACETVRPRIDREQVREVAALLQEIRDASETRRATPNFRDFTELAIPARVISLAHTMGLSVERRRLGR